MQGSVATENPTNSLSSLLASFASGHSEDYEDDNSRLPTEGQKQKQKATLASVGGASASKTGKSEEVPKEGATAGRMMFSIWNLLSSLFFSVSLPSLPKISFLSPRNCLHADRTKPRSPGRDHTSAGPLALKGRMIPGLRTEDLPTGRALEEMENFLRHHQPLPLEVRETHFNL